MLTGLIFSIWIFLYALNIVLPSRTLGEGLSAGAFGGLGGVWLLAYVITYIDEGTLTLDPELLDEWLLFTIFGAFWGAVFGFCWVLLKRIPALLGLTANVASGLSLRIAESNGAKKCAEEHAYSVIARELQEGELHQATWVKAYERASGEKKAAEAEYIRLRKADILSQR